MPTDYRERIYSNYVHARKEVLCRPDVSSLRPRADYLCKLISEFFPSDKNARILDLGCGHGAILYFARQAGYKNCVGVDVSSEQIELGQKLGIQGIIQNDLMEYLRAQPAASVDFVIAFDVIEHFTKSELLDFIDQVHRVLKSGGNWLIHTVNGESPFSGRMRYWDFTHENCFTRASMAQIMKSSGFSSVECYSDFMSMRRPTRWPRQWVWWLIQLFLRIWIMAETGDLSRPLLTQNFITIVYI